jgi:hypothetical protein
VSKLQAIYRVSTQDPARMQECNIIHEDIQRLLLVGGKEVSIEVNAEKIRYLIRGCIVNKKHDNITTQR